MPLNNLSTILNHRNGGRPYKYWRVGTRDGETHISYWDAMRNGNYVSIGGWELKDLTDLDLEGDKASKDKLRAHMENVFPGWTPQGIGKWNQQVFNFVSIIEDGDLILALEGANVLGIGKVTGDYIYEPDSKFSYCRPVQWLNLDEWKLPHPEGMRMAVHKYKRYYSNLIAIEKRILEPLQIPPQFSHPSPRKRKREFYPFQDWKG